MLLQIRDEGKLTDSLGFTVDFRHTLVVLTYNLGNEYVENADLSEDITKLNNDTRHKLERSLRNYFRPELIGRLEVIYFNFLDREAFSQICNLELIKLPAKFKEVNIRITDKVKEYVMDRSFNVNSGARNIEHAVEKEIQQPLVKILLKKNLTLDTKSFINIDAENECLSVGVLKDE